MLTYFLDMDGVLVDLPVDASWVDMKTSQWRSLPWTRTGQQLVDAVNKTGHDWYILSSPCTPESASGKMDWCWDNGFASAYTV